MPPALPGLGVGLVLRKRLTAFFPKSERPQTAQPRTIQHLFQPAEQLEIAEKKRQAEAAHQKHIAEVKALTAREKQTRKKVEDLLDNGRKIASV